ncbi:hypothetical protein F3Y22_tig00111877pilonHSYRG00076 [Hibiscus syriacus]|uniref:Uncharacterized protein n=1 Tax=Hibiscus syriacus TaxID=106335 RepID=A0A6A2YDT0_HIBSY|nr:hypothetical protein F3Y22_tig00111877pilonHSYRG00076 [Hibiscus syriacus]
MYTVDGDQRAVGREVLKDVVAQFNADQLLTESPQGPDHEHILKQKMEFQRSRSYQAVNGSDGSNNKTKKELKRKRGRDGIHCRSPLMPRVFGFPRRRMKLGRVKKVQLSESSHGIRSPTRPPKQSNNANIESTMPAGSHSDELESHCAAAPEINSSGNSENWLVLSVAMEAHVPRFNHASTVVGNKMIVVGGEFVNEILDDVQVLNFNTFSWTMASSKLYLSPSNLPLKIPSCKAHGLVSWGKKALLIGARADPGQACQDDLRKKFTYPKGYDVEAVYNCHLRSSKNSSKNYKALKRKIQNLMDSGAWTIEKGGIASTICTEGIVLFEHVFDISCLLNLLND